MANKRGERRIARRSRRSDALSPFIAGGSGRRASEGLPFVCVFRCERPRAQSQRMQRASAPATTNRRLSTPIRDTPVRRPRLASIAEAVPPADIRPKSRFASRGSKILAAWTQNWAMTRVDPASMKRKRARSTGNVWPKLMPSRMRRTSAIRRRSTFEPITIHLIGRRLTARL